MDQALQKRIAITLLILTLLAVLVFASVGGNKKVKETLASNGSSEDIAAQILRSDKDLPPNGDAAGDGVPNWQKVILGQDPYKKNLPPPSADISSSDLKRLNDDNNMTVALAKNNATISGYLNNLSDKSTINQEGLAEDALKATAAAFSFKTFSEKDLTNKIEPTQAKRKDYGNDLAKKTAQIVTFYSKVSDLAALKDVTDNITGSKNIAILKKKVADTTTFRNSLLTMPVPSDAVTYHLAFVNAVSAYLEVMQGFLNEKEDPLKAATFLRGYKTIVGNMFTTFGDESTYFNSANLAFTAKDYGYVFTVGLKKK